MRIRMVSMIDATGVATLLAFGGIAAASAGPEWCDDGSPPPNDWRFRATGGPSAGSSTAWLRSTTSGELDLATGVNTLQGGVAKGMGTALERAGSKEPPERHDHDTDEEDDEAEDDRD